MSPSSSKALVAFLACAREPIRRKVVPYEVHFKRQTLEVELVRVHLALLAQLFVHAQAWRTDWAFFGDSRYGGCCRREARRKHSVYAYGWCLFAVPDAWSVNHRWHRPQ